MIYNLSSDISNITNIPKLCLENLGKKAIDCITYGVKENLSAKETITAIDIEIGILYIKLIDDKISYKFIPSSDLEESISNAVLKNENPLIYKLETALATRIKNTYKGLY